MFDSHAHLCFPEFSKDINQVIADCKKVLRGVMVSSCRFDEGKQVLALVKKHPDFLYASIGYHPTEGSGLEEIISLIKNNADSIHAVGEVGLDYHWEKDSAKREAQKKAFGKFISLASQLKKPLVIHSWDAEQDAFDIVKGSGVPATFHCYTGKKDLALEITEAGFYISISTALFFSKNVKKVAKSIPLDKLLLETDSPFLDPDQTRKRNTPPNILLTAKKIASLRGITEDDVKKAALENAKRFFKINPQKP